MTKLETKTKLPNTSHVLRDKQTANKSLRNLMLLLDAPSIDYTTHTEVLDTKIKAKEVEGL